MQRYLLIYTLQRLSEKDPEILKEIQKNKEKEENQISEYEKNEIAVLFSCTVMNYNFKS
jgi:hypothetical protein